MRVGFEAEGVSYSGAISCVKGFERHQGWMSSNFEWSCKVFVSVEV